jgi:Ca-activated chloride channel family protein
MIGFQRTFRVALCLTCLGWAGSLWAADSERDVAVEINRANALLRGGDVDAAVEAYRHVQSKAADRADLSYNMAVAQYRKGDMAAAEQLFNQVSSADDDVLAASARYNLGNCHYASALQLAEADQSAAIQRFQNAIDSYRGALEIDPNDTDSRANIELAAAMIDKLQNQHKEQLQQQSQSQPQDQQQQRDRQQQNQQSQSGDQNDQNQENTQQANSEQQQQQQNSQQPSQDQRQSQENQQQAQSDSSQTNESKGQQGSQNKPQGADSNSKQSQSQPDKPQANSEADELADKTTNQGPQQPQPTSQQRSTEQRSRQDETQQPDQPNEQKGSAAPKGALSAADQEAGKKAQQDSTSVGELEPVPDAAMTVQEAEKMLQAIRDQEMVRRLRRQAAERNRRVPVERDW